jgi:hypothetical protein
VFVIFSGYLSTRVHRAPTPAPEKKSGGRKGADGKVSKKRKHKAVKPQQKPGSWT